MSISRFVVISAVASVCKLFKAFACRLSTIGHSELIHTLRTRKRPLITISNHKSTLDDPFILASILPWDILLSLKLSRYSLGAQEICFRTRLLSWFFNSGGVIPIIRGMGIFQPSMNLALKMLNDNHWIHIFPEGKVNQTSSLLRFKWGVARLIMESEIPPLIIIMHHTGLENVMPEDSLVKFPRFGKNVSCTFSHPIDSTNLLDSIKNMSEKDQRIFISNYLFNQTQILATKTKT